MLKPRDGPRTPINLPSLLNSAMESSSSEEKQSSVRRILEMSRGLLSTAVTSDSTLRSRSPGISTPAAPPWDVPKSGPITSSTLSRPDNDPAMPKCETFRASPLPASGGVFVNTPRNTVTWFWLHDAMFDWLKNRLISPIFRFVDFAISIFQLRFACLSPLPFSIRFSCLQVHKAGGHSISLGVCPTKLPVIWDTGFDQSSVPASLLKWQEAISQGPPFDRLSTPIPIRFFFFGFNPIAIRPSSDFFSISIRCQYGLHFAYSSKSDGEIGRHAKIGRLGQSGLLLLLGPTYNVLC